MNPLTAMGRHSLIHRDTTLDRSTAAVATHAPFALIPQSPPSHASHRFFEHALTCPDLEAILRNTLPEVVGSHFGSINLAELC
jgi:hypothetical protein